MTFWLLVLGLLAGWFVGAWWAGGGGFWRGVGHELLVAPFDVAVFAWVVSLLIIFSTPAGLDWWADLVLLVFLMLMTAALRAAWRTPDDD